MNDKDFENFSFRPKRPDTAPTVSEDGVVTGEIGGAQESALDPSEAYRRIEAEGRKDAMLAEAFETVGDGEPAERASLVLDRINALRRDLATADMDPAMKRDRDQWLSDLANRLRELL